MKLKYIGKYDLGLHICDLYIDPNISDGRFTCVHEATGRTRIVVGTRGSSWLYIVSVLQHEALELAFTVMGLRFTPCPDYSNDNGGFQFIMTHTQFSEASARAAYFIAAALPDLKKALKGRK